MYLNKFNLLILLLVLKITRQKNIKVNNRLYNKNEGNMFKVFI